MTKKAIISLERIENKIYLIRKHKVMLDRDLAELYGVTTKVLNQAVKRNLKRFPGDFMFQLSKEEFEIWKSQIVTSKSDKMGLRKKSYVFTENGVAMLSSVLNSERAIEVNIQIIRVFIKLRQMLATHADLKRKIEAMEKKYDKQFAIVFQVIQELMTPPEKPRKKIGFRK